MRSTSPTGRSSSSARARCSGPAYAPAEMTLIAWSTSTGVLDMTRITGTSTPSRRSLKPVGMTAATEMISLPAGTCGLISSSIAGMSCGLTVMISVSALLAASAALRMATPYSIRSCSARSGRRTTAATPDGGRPARSSPEMSASPFCPAPKIPITVWSLTRPTASPGGGQRAQEERHVCRPLGQPPDQVAVPVAAVGQVHPDLRAGAGQPALLGRPDPVQHLELEALRRPRGQRGLRRADLDQPPVVGGQHRVARAVHQHPQRAGVAAVHLVPGGER